jgi:trigger factor
MKTSVKHLSDTKVQLTISLNAKELTDAEQVALTKLAKEIKAPGFRKGNVPASVAAKHVDPNALTQQTMEDALSKAVAEAFLAEKLQALDRPAVEVTKFVPRKEMEFTAEVEILPTIKLGDYKKLGVKQQKVSVTDGEIDDILTRMREGMAEKKDVTRAAKDADEVMIDFVGKKDGVAFDGGTGTDYSLKLGSNTFIPGFEEGIVGKKPGETFDLELTFPEDYHSADLAGATVVFSTTLKSVQELVLPELNDEFAKKAGKDFETLKDLKDDIKRELTAQKDREAGEKLKDELVGALVEVSTVPTPQILVDDQAKNIEQDMQRNLTYQNITLDQYIQSQKFKDEADWRAKEVLPAAEKRVKAGLVLAELSKVLKVDATSEELAEHINLYKQQYSNDPEALKQFEQPEVQRDIANRLLTEKTVEKLVDLNKD